MTLATYHRKRSFTATPEPRGWVGARRAKEPIFVVQEHHASHLHYDFRLEADGVLKSWAVPKGPAKSTRTKRLAVQVEDHPLAYATFHGKIPAGQYGAGTVKIWDHGTYENITTKDGKLVPLTRAIRNGHLEVVLHGTELRGGYALIRFKGKKDWLLVKMKKKS